MVRFVAFVRKDFNFCLYVFRVDVPNNAAGVCAVVFRSILRSIALVPQGAVCIQEFQENTIN